MRTAAYVISISVALAFIRGSALADALSGEEQEGPCKVMCAEVRYMVDYQYGNTGTCREWRTDGADALLSANTKCVDGINSSSPVGGKGTAHPSIKRQQRHWSYCGFACSYGPGMLVEAVPFNATATPWGSWVSACYCKTDS